MTPLRVTSFRTITLASLTSKEAMKSRLVTSSSSPFRMTSMYSQRTGRGIARARSATKKPAPFRMAIRTIGPFR